MPRSGGSVLFPSQRGPLGVYLMAMASSAAPLVREKRMFSRMHNFVSGSGSAGVSGSSYAGVPGSGSAGVPGSRFAGVSGSGSAGVSWCREKRRSACDTIKSAVVAIKDPFGNGEIDCLGVVVRQKSMVAYNSCFKYIDRGSVRANIRWITTNSEFTMKFSVENEKENIIGVFSPETLPANTVPYIDVQTDEVKDFNSGKLTTFCPSKKTSNIKSFHGERADIFKSFEVEFVDLRSCASLFNDDSAVVISDDYDENLLCVRGKEKQKSSGCRGEIRGTPLIWEPELGHPELVGLYHLKAMQGGYNYYIYVATKNFLMSLKAPGAYGQI